MKPLEADLDQARGELTRVITGAIIRSERLNQQFGKKAVNRWPERVRDVLLDAMVILETESEEVVRNTVRASREGQS